MRRLLMPFVLLPHLAAADTAVVEQAPAPAVADEAIYTCKHQPGDVVVTFKPETELKDLLTWVMGFTCKQFVYDPRIVATARKVVVIAPEKMSPAEAYQLFLAALSRMGYAVVAKGKTLHIVEAQQVKREPLPIVKSPDDTDQVVRFVLRPSYAKPEALRAALDPLKSDAGDVTQLGAILLVTDYASHVRDMLSLAKLVDVPGGSEGIYTLALQHADASKLLPKIEAILGITSAAGALAPAAGAPGKAASDAPAAPTPSKILVDERTNTLILASSDAGYQRVKALVERLDVALDIEGGASIHVYQLQNAIAEEVAKVVNDAIAKQGSATPGGARPPGATGSGGIGLEGQAHVIADKASNKLIVTSTGRDFLAIRDVIGELDQPRRQVYIETVVLEVDLDNELDVGSSSHGGVPIGNGSGLALGGVQTTHLSSLDPKDSLANAAGLIGGLVGGPLTASQTILGTSIPSYAVLFQALATSSHTNLMSTPSIIAIDNEESKFHVGQNVPYKRGVVPVSPTTTTITTTNIDRQDLNFELDIKPHISANDNVLLEIKNDAKDLGTSDPELGPSWNTRGFETRVVVRDQQTIVLTGLMQQKEVSTAAKVPLLGDIPVVGYLFKYTTHTKKKSNLLIMLTPYIVKDQLDLQQIQERKLREHDEFVAANAALDHMRYLPRTDYRRKRGVVEEINRAVIGVEQDAEARQELHDGPRVPSGPVQ